MKTIKHMIISDTVTTIIDLHRINFWFKGNGPKIQQFYNDYHADIKSVFNMHTEHSMVIHHIFKSILYNN